MRLYVIKKHAMENTLRFLSKNIWYKNAVHIDCRFCCFRVYKVKYNSVSCCCNGRWNSLRHTSSKPRNNIHCASNWNIDCTKIYKTLKQRQHFKRLKTTRDSLQQLWWRVQLLEISIFWVVPFWFQTTLGFLQDDENTLQNIYNL